MDEDDLTKTCTGCHEKKPLYEFSQSPFYNDGYRPRCKECMRKYYQEYERKRRKEAPA